MLIRGCDEFDLNAESVMSHITRWLRLAIINSSNSSTNAAFSSDVLLNLMKLVSERDLIVISDQVYDQVYERIVYDAAQHFCLVILPECKKDLLLLTLFEDLGYDRFSR